MTPDTDSPRDEVTVTQTLAEFEAYLAQKAIAPSTAAQYLRDVEGFIHHIDERQAGPGNLRVSERTIERYLIFLRATGARRSTVRRKTTSLRHLVAASSDDEEVRAAFSPRGIRFPDERKLRTQIIPQAIEAVLNAPGISTALGRRDSAMLYLLFGTGMQVKELCALRVGDWDGDAQRLQVGDGRREREAQILQSACPAFARYLLDIQHMLPEELMFRSARGQPLSPRDITRIVAGYVETRGLPRGA